MQYHYNKSIQTNGRYDTLRDTDANGSPFVIAVKVHGDGADLP